MQNLYLNFPMYACIGGSHSGWPHCYVLILRLDSVAFGDTVMGARKVKIG
jgi:hypothetical protein